LAGYADGAGFRLRSAARASKSWASRKAGYIPRIATEKRASFDERAMPT
jgi:hypothetical protein